MDTRQTFDVIGIGISPFNLRLADLLRLIEGLSDLFFDQADCFDCHSGLMLNHATLYVFFIADLVTIVDPIS